MDLGKIGIWRVSREQSDVVTELEALGYGALWVGGSPTVAQIRPFLEQSQTLPIATGIVNVWKVDADVAAAERAELERDFPGRFLLGIGIGHPEATREYDTPLATMRAYFDALDATMRAYFDALDAAGVPREAMVAAALGPKMLRLAVERSLGTHPYFTPPEHTRFARETVGPDALVAPELAVVVEPDEAAARAIAREYATGYLRRSNYTRNLLRFGFTEADIADGGSDRLIDTIVPHGSAEAIAEHVRAHLDAGADHVCLQPLGHGPAPLDDYRALAAVLL